MLGHRRQATFGSAAGLIAIVADVYGRAYVAQEELEDRAAVLEHRLEGGDAIAAEQVFAMIDADEADVPRSTKLTAFTPPAWRVGVGHYRVVYEIDDDRVVVVIVNVAPRGEVYR